MTAPPASRRLQTLLVRGALALLMVGLLVRAVSRFVPGGSLVGAYNSDMAIPLLMTRGSWLGLFDVYYYGQDRYGAWPYLLARAAHQVFGFDWTAVSLHQAYVAAALLTAVPLALLSRRAGLVAAAAWVLIAVTNPSLGRSYLGSAQPYGFQGVVLCGAWAVLHSLMSRPERPRRRLAALAVLSFLSIWMSTTSGPFLTVLLGMEVLGRWRAVPWRGLLRRVVPIGGMVLLGVLGERLLRTGFRYAAQRDYNVPVRTWVHLDLGHLLENLRAVAEVWSRDGGWLVLVLAVVGTGVFGVLALRRPREARGGETPAGGETLLLAASAVAVAALNFAVCVAVNHVRLNDYNERYLALTHLFLAVAAALVVLAALEALLAHRLVALEAVVPLLALGLLGAAYLRMPEPEPLAEERVLEDTARALQPEQGERVVLGNYWHTYVYAALARPGAVVAVPAEKQYLRTPFDLARLRAADAVVVNHEGMESFGPASAPYTLISQYGVLLRLERPATPREGFSLYTPVRQVLPATPEPVLRDWRLCTGAGQQATLRFESSGPVVLLVRSAGVREGSPLPRVELDGRALPVDVLPDFYRVRVDVPVKPTERLELGGISGLKEDAPGCRVRDVFVLPEAVARSLF
ncbi:hypothetical protein [Archangium violaceum]|uniref:hypothetical protein n=1 Tax=Archangium violaceum TaxID=83451 RepID=UPI0036D91912